MQTEILSDAGAIIEEWWDLWRRDAAATPFQSPAWLLPWRRHFPDGDTVVLTLRDFGRLIALLPLFSHDGRLLPWGAGTTDWLDGVFDPGLDLAALSRGIAWLPLPLDLFQIPAGSPLLRVQPPGGWTACAGIAGSCAVLSLPASFSTKVAQNLRYYRRRAERAGAEAPRRLDSGSFQALADLHTRRWRERGEPGIFADPRMVAWQREALPALDAAGLLQLYVVERDAAVIAVLCVLAAKRRSFYYIGGFDPDLAALGLGTVLVGHAVSEAERQGHGSFDFLRGREPYKYRWGAQDQPAHARWLAPPRWEERA